MSISPTIPRQVSRIDWQRWQPVDRATLLFIVDEDHATEERILLIRKKRGLGAGKINGPGGRLEPGEATIDGARREVEEEVCVTPLGIEKSGELLFQFVDGYSIHVWVFRARSFSGEPRETEEAVPLWFSLNEIPYEEMWEDDRVWLPCMLDRKPFLGRFIFEDDTMVDYQLEVKSAATDCDGAPEE